MKDATIVDAEKSAVCTGESNETLAGELSSVLEARAAFYETLASLYFMPLKQDDVDNIANADFSAYVGINDEFDEGINDITRYLRKRNTGTRDELAVDFTGAFAGVRAYEGKVAVPYKSVFTNAEGLLCQGGYRDVFHAYKAECVKKREGLDWPDDHISFLCEFMALLSRRTIKALDEGDTVQALHELRASDDFLANNILSWFDAFSERASLVIKTRFYRGVLKVSKGFFVFDKETIVELMDAVREEMNGESQA